MYCGLMVTDTAVFEVNDGPETAEFYPAHTPMRDRVHPGLAFILEPSRPWQWTGRGSPETVTLTDVLAAVSYARITGHPWQPPEAPEGMAAIHRAHQAAADTAAAAGDDRLAARLRSEQAEVAAPALVSEEIAAKRLDITGKSLNNLRLQYRTICAPVLIAGDMRTRWFWAPAQFDRWQRDRPGRGWRKGRGMSYPQGQCPACGSEVALTAGADGTIRPIRRHRRPDTRDWCTAPGGTSAHDRC